MKKLDSKTTTYSITKEYLVDIVETEDRFEAYIFTEDDIMKQFVTGCPRNALSKDEFVEQVERNIDDYITEYEMIRYIGDEGEEPEWE